MGRRLIRRRTPKTHRCPKCGTFGSLRLELDRSIRYRVVSVDLSDPARPLYVLDEETDSMSETDPRLECEACGTSFTPPEEWEIS